MFWIVVLCQDGEEAEDAEAMGEEEMSAGDPADEDTATSGGMVDGGYR